MSGYAVQAEEVRTRLHRTALEAMKQGTDPVGVEFCLCPTCGSIEMGRPEKPRPVFVAKPVRFVGAE